MKTINFLDGMEQKLNELTRLWWGEEWYETHYDDSVEAFVNEIMDLFCEFAEDYADKAIDNWIARDEHDFVEEK